MINEEDKELFRKSLVKILIGKELEDGRFLGVRVASCNWRNELIFTVGDINKWAKAIKENNPEQDNVEDMKMLITVIPERGNIE